MMRAVRHAVTLLLLFGLAGCGLLQPHETVNPPISKGQTDPGPRVSVCYNAFTTTAEAVRAIAAENCEAGTTPKPLDREIGLDSCPLLIPERGTFICVKP